MSDATSPKEPDASADPRSGWRYAEANRKGRGVRAISIVDLAAMLIASFRLGVTARRSRRDARPA
jgi:hypothetical protein